MIIPGSGRGTSDRNYSFTLYWESIKKNGIGFSGLNMVAVSGENEGKQFAMRGEIRVVALRKVAFSSFFVVRSAEEDGFIIIKCPFETMIKKENMFGTESAFGMPEVAQLPVGDPHAVGPFGNGLRSCFQKCPGRHVESVVSVP